MSALRGQVDAQPGDGDGGGQRVAPRGIRRALLATLPFLLAGALAAGLGFLPAAELRIYWFARFVVPLLWLNLAGAAALAWWVLRDATRAGRGDVAGADLIACAALVLVTAGLSLDLPARMRVQLDEAQIAGSAFGVWLERTPIVPATGLYEPDGTLQPYVLDVDKRGALLPTLIASVQAPGHFDLNRGFGLNLALGCLALFACYFLLRCWWPPPSALAAVLLVCANPAFAWAVRSLGLETLNLALLAAASILVITALRSRSVPQALLLAWLGPLLAQTRYESVLASMATLAVALVILARAPARGPSRALWALVPLLYLPVAWQRAKAYDLGLDVVGEDHAFGLDFLARNTVAAFRFFLVPNEFNPLAPAQLVLAAGAVVVVALGLRNRAGVGGADRWGIGVLIAMVAAITTTVLAMAWGNFNWATNVRLGLPLMVAMAAASAFLLRWLRARRLLPQGGELLVAGALLLGALPAIGGEAGYHRMLTGPALNHVDDWMRAAFPGCRIVIGSTYAPFFVSRGHSALTPAELQQRWPELQARAREGRLDAVLAVQVADVRAGGPLAGNGVDPRFSQRELETTTLSPLVAVRIVSVDLPEAPLGAVGDGACALSRPPPRPAGA